MLQDAQARHAAGTEVLIGVVETHGRKETIALLEGLPIVPRAKLEYKGTAIDEMDLDAILLWHPPLVIVDELAHTNAPGSRHPKRYQDVLELLDAGIDVYSTVNVQHIESRRDTVAQITGITVRETIPDSVLDCASDIVLIDLTPEELRARLAAGKVYLGDRAEAAAENFFRESNLLALREMALRIVAEHVDRDLRDAMQQQHIPGPWKSGDRLLVAVSASPFSEKLIRYTRRLSATMEASWIAVNIETARPLTEQEQVRLTGYLALARQLGAEVVSTSGIEVGDAILRVARQHNVTQIVLGKPVGASWFRRDSPAEWLIRNSGDIDLHMIRSDERPEPSSLTLWRRGGHASARQYAEAAAIVAAVTVLGLALVKVIGYLAVALVYLLVVVLSAMRLRRGPILFLATGSALLWNFLFIPPSLTFYISSAQDWIMFALYFVVALVIGHLTTRLRDRERAERKAEARATALYRLTREVAASASLDEAVRAVLKQVRETIEGPAAVLVRDDAGIVPHPASTLALSAKEESVANWTFQKMQSAGRFTDTLPDAEALHIPLLAGERCEGVLVCRPASVPTIDQREFLDAIAGQLGTFVQRDRATHSVREAQVAAHSQKLQKALLDSVSHELKTPLATVSGLLDQPEPDCREIRDAIRRLNRTVDLLLDATRLESGLLRPNLEWCEPLELASEAIALTEVSGRKIDITSAPGVPMIRVDAGLVAQALSMLISNASAHSPGGTPIDLRVTEDAGTVAFCVQDRGPGIPPGDEEKIFEKFYRGPGAAAGGLGLGLSIARQLADLNGGTLRAQNRPGGGALFTLRLPASERMQLPEERIA
jgi:two-component system sensor histidine kinase KdpD